MDIYFGTIKLLVKILEVYIFFLFFFKKCHSVSQSEHCRQQNREIWRNLQERKRTEAHEYTSLKGKYHCYNSRCCYRGILLPASCQRFEGNGISTVNSKYYYQNFSFFIISELLLVFSSYANLSLYCWRSCSLTQTELIANQ